MPAVSKLIASLEPSATLAMAAKAKELTAAGKKVFDFSVGEPDFNTPEHICAAGTKAMKDGHTKYTVASGAILKITATDPGSVRDFAAFAKQTGHNLVDSGEAGKEFFFFLKKK